MHARNYSVIVTIIKFGIIESGHVENAFLQKQKHSFLKNPQVPEISLPFFISLPFGKRYFLFFFEIKYFISTNQVTKKSTT